MLRTWFADPFAGCETLAAFLPELHRMSANLGAGRRSDDDYSLD
jgi:hypothetical protein